MTDATPRLSLPLLAAAQSQKHVTHNEALIALDRLIHLTAVDCRGTPPATPAEGEAYIVSDVATAAFAGREGALATFVDGAWRFDIPARGWIAWLSAEARAMVFDGNAWADLKPHAADRLGIAAAADDTNRLAVASPAVLFTHAGAGTQVKVNKATAGDTASVLFQTGWSGRAEFGLAGDDDWHVKVSPDGAAWREALIADRASGRLTLPQGARVPDGAKIANDGTSATSGLDLEGGGIYGKVGLVIKSVTGLTGALFEQRAHPESGIDLIDFGFKSLTQQMNLRVESRAPFTFSRGTPEFQIGVQAGPPVGLVNLFAVSPNRAMVQVPLALKGYPVAALPSPAAAGAGAMIYVSDAAGGGVPAFSDGAAWRRVTDRSIVN